jgi:hypothetical protein
MTWLSRLAQRSVVELTRVACFLALAGLAVIVYPIVAPSPLGIIVAMSIGHTIGIAAFACYLLAVLVDVARLRRLSARGPVSAPAPPPDESATSSHPPGE